MVASGIMDTSREHGGDNNILTFVMLILMKH